MLSIFRNYKPLVCFRTPPPKESFRKRLRRHNLDRARLTPLREEKIKGKMPAQYS